MCCYVRSSSRRKAGVIALKAIGLPEMRTYCVHSTNVATRTLSTDGEQNTPLG